MRINGLYELHGRDIIYVMDFFLKKKTTFQEPIMFMCADIW